MSAAILQQPSPSRAALPVSVERVLAALTADLAPVAVQRVPLREAEGAVLAEALLVPAPIPARPVALRSGYAVASADTFGAGPYAPLPLPRVPQLIEAGGTLPEGADAVLPEDAVLLAGGLAEAQESAAPGLWTRRAGEDAPAGAVVKQAGQVLRAADIAVAEAADIAECEVRRVRVFRSGPDSPASRLASALVRSAGARDAASIEEADLVFSTGETAEEFQRKTGEPTDIVAQRLALRPAEEGAVLRRGSLPVLLAPDRLADALGLWLALALPIIRAISGVSASRTEERPVSRKISSTVGVSELALLRCTGRRFEPIGIADLSLPAIAAADAWALLPPESEGVAAGEVIEAELFAP